MNFWDDLHRVEARIAAEIDAAGESETIRRFHVSFVERILSLLDDYTPEELETLDLEQVVKEAMVEYADFISRDLTAELSEHIREAVTASLRFYEGRGIDTEGIYEEVKRSEAAARLSQNFAKSLRHSYAELRRGTVAVLQEAILSGNPDRKAIEAGIRQYGAVAEEHARTEARAVVSAYNQYSRNVLREKAELTHGLYYGHLQQNSRPFCRVHLMKTFTKEQIDAMDNGMLNPVRVHRGGYRCMHSWVWVDPEWDEALTPADGGRVRRVRYKSQAITVYANDAQAARLKRQMELGNQGFAMFRDSRTNDRGFAALHGSWINAWKGSRKPLKNEFKTEFEAGLILADLGHESLFDRRVLNNLGAPVDIILDGVAMEIKTPVKFNAKTVWNRIVKSKNKAGIYQGDEYILNLTEPMTDEMRRELLTKISKWYKGHGDKTIYILHHYEPFELEEIKK